MAKNRKSRDQKRQTKLAKKKKETRQENPLAYTGSRYKRDDLATIWLQTEIAIYEIFRVTDRELLDASVAEALEILIHDLKSGPMTEVLQEFEEATPENAKGDVDLVAANIRLRWTELFWEEERPARDDLIGILRSILGLIEIVPRHTDRARTYLHYIENFLSKEVGVNVETGILELDEDEM